MSEIIQAVGLFLQLAIQMGTPLLLGTLGGILNEKAGHINLGLEGTMLMGAAFGFYAGYHTQNPILAILVSGFAGILSGLIYAIVTVTFKGNQTVAGFAITVFGTGLANFSGKTLAGLTLSENFMEQIGTKQIPILSKIPILGTAVFTQSYYVMGSILIAIILAFYMKKTRFGLSLRMVGENPSAADVSGIPVNLYKYIHIMAGGFLTALGGAYISLVFVSRWQDDMTAGMGWIAVALVIFSTWNPAKAIWGAYLFGALRVTSYKLQNIDLNLLGSRIQISSQLLDMLPYLMTVIVLIIITLKKKRENQAPAWLGRAYFREER